ncbi:hypothetical protein P22_0080 [Propionispora sp. 2/2-37]|uniref:GHMP family kinase ATP-binding protein n=1 Tax=Propionispora sp. 2/2-37 TaxID=1677858 RepID=UPI0006BB703E|nr:GHMP kinase [Propionispora sp. 2/2-37]CUH94018.1 hypothetical protein P22_0080 [Propionispora sp. 2/2-37]
MKVKVEVPGSCGELVQGTIAGQNFLITCPVDLYSCIEMTAGEYDLEHEPEKVRLAIERTFAYLGRKRPDCRIKVVSELLTGKGMASSSADISAACQAAALWAGVEITVDEIADIALAIEPTDAVFYPGIVMFDHLQGRVRRQLGRPPHINIALFDTGGEIDTLEFNRRKDLHSLNSNKEEKIIEAVNQVVKGIASGNPELIGSGATLSALANQPILYKEYLEEVISVSKAYGAFGVNVAHSGTIVGILYSPAKPEQLVECILAVQVACPGIRYIRTVKLISGGLRIQVGD